MMSNLQIKISYNEKELNRLYYVKTDLDSLSISERQALFSESFLSIETDTVLSENRTARQSCNIWDKIDFHLETNEVQISSVSFTKSQMLSEMNNNSLTVGEFIENQYQNLIV